MSRSASQVTGIVLAAGSSRRMGRDKLYLELGGESLLRRSCGCALAAGLSPLVVVAGPDPDRARRELEGLAATVVENPDHARGMDTSLRRGIAAVPDASPAALVMLADMPFVTPAMVRRVLDTWASAADDRALVVSRYGEVQAPPTLYGRALFGEFGAGRCGRHVVADHMDVAEVLAFPPDALCDLDVEDDYRRARERFAAAAGGTG